MQKYPGNMYENNIVITGILSCYGLSFIRNDIKRKLVKNIVSKYNNEICIKKDITIGLTTN
jgi:hypothetical protein